MKNLYKNLLSIEDAENLEIKDIWKHYEDYISTSQVDLISSFGFGREKAINAEGCYIYTKENKILDLTGGIGVLNHGHNHPRILSARRNFNKMKRMEVHKNFFSPYLAALSHNVAELLPGDLNISYFPNSGGEAVEGALKMAYKFHNGNRKFVLHSDISFHGKLLGAASLTGSPELSFKFPQIPNVESFEYNNINSIKEKIDKLRTQTNQSDIYGIVLEPFNASSMRNCSKEFLLELRLLCDKEKIILIFDEVYTGWGRMGYLFYFMKYENLLPDILTYAKSFGGGKASIAGYTAREEIYRTAYDNLNDATLHSTTYYGFGEECATAIEAINIIVEDNLISKSKILGNKFEDGLKILHQKYPKIINEIRGEGAQWGVILNPGLIKSIFTMVSKIIPGKFFKDKRFVNKLITASVINSLYEDHKILTFYGSNYDIPLILSFPLVAKEEEIKYALVSLDKTFSKGISKIVLSFIKSKFSKI
jgi:putrescine aminotransferase